MSTTLTDVAKGLQKTLWSLAIATFSATVNANAILNGDFASGTFAGWTTFTTASGSLGPAGFPNINSFDVTGGGASNAARFQVGIRSSSTGQQGGGIFQSITVGAGTLTASADIAAWDSTSFNGSNAEWGLFSLLIDGTVVDSVNFGSPICCSPVRDSLSGSLTVATGSHEIRLLITRSFFPGPDGVSPYQYIDNVVADVNGVPEPATLGLLAISVAGVWFSRRKLN